MFLVIFLYMLMASTFTIGKVIMSYLNPLFFIGVRMIVGGGCLLAYQYLFKRDSFCIKKKDYLLFAGLAFFHIFLTFCCEFWALGRMGSAKLCLFFNLMPFVTALLSYILFTEKITKKQFAGLVIGFLGFLPILMGQNFETSAVGFMSWAEIVLLVSVFSGAYGWIIMQQLVDKDDYSPVFANGIGMFFGGILSMFASLAVEGAPKLLMTSGSLTTDLLTVVGYTGLLIIIANFICYNLYGFLLRSYTATFVSFAGFICPLFTAVYGWFFLGETVGWAFFATSVIVLFGLYIFHQDELKKGFIK